MKNIVLSIVATSALMAGGPASANPDEADVRTLFTKFINAQNAHDANEIRAVLWDSPETFIISRGRVTKGAATIADRFKQNFQGTWHAEPDMTRFEITNISDDVVQILVPVEFTRGLPGDAAKNDTSLMSQILIKGKEGWRIASILQVVNTQSK